MASGNGSKGPSDRGLEETARRQCQTIECQLFESLTHQLIEKGVLTKNDALSVVQTVAEVKRGELEEEQAQTAAIREELTILERLYSSFELIRERPPVSESYDGGNVLRLRPPLHGDDPKFPDDE